MARASPGKTVSVWPASVSARWSSPGLAGLGAHEVVVAHVDEEHERALLDVALDGERQVGVAAAGVDALDLGPVVGEPVERDGAVLGRAAGEVGGARRGRRDSSEKSTAD